MGPEGMGGGLEQFLMWLKRRQQMQQMQQPQGQGLLVPMSSGGVPMGYGQGQGQQTGQIPNVNGGMQGMQRPQMAPQGTMGSGGYGYKPMLGGQRW